jgi:alanine-synthesizing transaminase
VFSERTSYPRAKNRLTLALERRRAEGAPVFDLTESNPTRAGFVYPQTEILAALSDPRLLLYEPRPFGLEAARHAIAGYYAHRGSRVDPSQIVITASTSEAYSFLFKLLADPGGEVLVPQPSYPLFDFLARLDGVTTSFYSLVYDGAWRMDFERLEAALTPRTRAVIVVSPNNPTGSRLKRDEWDRLACVCLGHNLAVIWDEVFHDYPLDPTAEAFDPLGQDQVPVFVLNGLSKTVALPQLKLGWIVVAGSQALRREALERLEIVADTYLSVATGTQHAVSRLLDLRSGIQSQITRRLRSNLDALSRTLADSPARALPVEAGWYAVVRLPQTRSEEEWVVDLLEEHGALLHPGYFYDFESGPFVVVSLLPPTEVFSEGIASLNNLARR